MHILIPSDPMLRVVAMCDELRAQGVDPVALAGALTVQAAHLRAIAEQRAEAPHQIRASA